MSEQTVRKFERLNHPEPDDDGVQRYDVFETGRGDSGSRTYTPVARNLTFEESEAFVQENGEFDD